MPNPINTFKSKRDEERKVDVPSIQPLVPQPVTDKEEKKDTPPSSSLPLQPAVAVQSPITQDLPTPQQALASAAPTQPIELPLATMEMPSSEPSAGVGLFYGDTILNNARRKLEEQISKRQGFYEDYIRSKSAQTHSSSVTNRETEDLLGSLAPKFDHLRPDVLENPLNNALLPGNRFSATPMPPSTYDEAVSSVGASMFDWFEKLNQQKIGEYGKGVMGVLLYALNTPQSAVLGGISDIVDLLQGRTKPLDETRFIKAFKGTDFTFTSPVTPEKPFAIVGTKESPKTIGELKKRSPLWNAIMQTPYVSLATKAVAAIQGKREDDIELPATDVSFFGKRSLFQLAEFTTGLALSAVLDPLDWLVGGITSLAPASKVISNAEDVVSQTKKIAKSTIKAIDDKAIEITPTVVQKVLDKKPIPDVPVVSGSAIPKPEITVLLTEKDRARIVKNILPHDYGFKSIEDVNNWLNTLFDAAKQLATEKSNVKEIRLIEEGLRQTIDDYHQSLIGVERRVLQDNPDNIEIPPIEFEYTIPSNAKLPEGVELYHGSRILTNPFNDPIEGSARNDLGVAHYFTKNYDEAKNYALKLPNINIPPAVEGRELVEQGFIRSVNINGGNFLDASKVPPSGVKELFVDSYEKAFSLDVASTIASRIRNNSTPLRDYFTIADETIAEMLGEVAGDERSALIAQRIFAKQLRASGIDGIIDDDGGVVAILNHNVIDPITTVTVDPVDDVATATAAYNASLAALARNPRSKLLEADVNATRIEVLTKKAFAKVKELETVRAENLIAVRDLISGIEKLKQQGVGDEALKARALERRIQQSSKYIARQEFRPVAEEPVPAPPTILEAVENKATKPATIEPSSVAKEADIHHDILTITASPPKPETGGFSVTTAAQLQARADEKLIRELGQIVTLNPNAASSIEKFAVLEFNQKAAMLGLDPFHLGQVGQIKYNLQEVRRIAAGMVKNASDYTMAKTVRELGSTVRSLSRQLGINYEEFLDDLLRVGGFQQQLAVYDVLPAGRAYMEFAYEEFINKYSRLIPQQQLDELIKTATNAYAISDEIKAIASGLGVYNGSIEGLGSFYNILTGKARYMLKSKAREMAVGSPSDLLLQAVQKTSTYIPENKVLLAEKLGIPVEEVSAMVDANTFSKWLVDNKSTNEITKLVDAGLIQALPSTRRDLFDYMVRTLDLPFRGLNDMFVLDPAAAIKTYGDELAKLAEDASIETFLLRHGVEYGYASLDPMRNFVPKVIKGQTVYLHPDVDAVYTSIKELATKPERLGTFSLVLSEAFRLLSSGALIDPRYVARIVASGFIQAGAAGANLLRIPEGMYDLIKVKRFGLDAIDNTRRVYKDGNNLLTKRELLEKFLMHRGNVYAPHTGFRIADGIDSSSLLQRGINFHRFALSGLNLGKALKLGYDVHSSLVSAFATASAFTETAYRWVTLMSRLDTSAGNSIGQFVSTLRLPRQLNTVNDALRYIDDYFFMGDEAGRIPLIISRYVKPFAVYAMTNPPAQIRHAMRHPQAYLNYWRIRSFINTEAETDKQARPVATPEWLNDSAPLYLFKRDGNWVALLTTSFDPIADASSFIKSTLEKSIAAMGGTPANYRDLLAKAEGRMNSLSIMAEFFKDAYEPYQLAVSALTGVDISTGWKFDISDLREQPSFLGIRMSNLAKTILSMYTPLQRLNRDNPFNVFGVPTIKDPKTGRVIVKGTPSVFGVERTDVDITKYHPSTQQWYIQAIRNSGFNMRLVETASNMQLMFGDVRKVADELKNKINYAGRRLLLEPPADRNEYERLVNARREAIQQYFQFALDLARMNAYMKANKIPSRELFRRLEAEAIKGLPMPGDDEVERILSDVDRMVRME